MLNNTGERPHPCLTPLFMCIDSDIPSLNLTSSIPLLDYDMIYLTAVG